MKKNISALIYALILSASSTYFINSKSYNLEKNGNWTSVKQNLEFPPMQSDSFVKEPFSIKHGLLNLGSWHGYQEVYLKREYQAKKIEVSFELEDNSHLILLLKDKSGLRWGLRLSNNSHHPSSLLRINEIGKFTEKVLLNIVLPSEVTHKVSFIKNDFDYKLILNGSEIGVGKDLAKQALKIGFRGSSRYSYLKNLIIEDQSDLTFIEDFYDWSRAWLIFLTSLGLFGLGIYALIKYFSPRLYVLLNTATLCLSAGAFADYYYFSKFYSIDVNILGEAQIAAAEDERQRGLQYFYKEQVLHFKEILNRKEERVNNFFIGSSQTWGEGTSSKSSQWVTRYCEAIKGSCINLGIKAITADSYFPRYKDHLVSFKPKRVFLIFSTNDFKRESRFKDAINDFIVLNNQNNIETILVLEPNDPDYRSYIENHEILRELGKKHSKLTIDMVKPFMENRDTGLLWWDFVHLTDYGHEVFAKEFIKAFN
ncbi:MAG: hypothetical protein K9K67_08930 [Bacteriovoracaceae bacterium]|nr:hypothetical protein [Bacteriovoracaceae bacterium]